jgi:uncharacterized protein YecT (DUF1311 family)
MHLLFECPSEFDFQVREDKLSFSYKDINADTNSTEFFQSKGNKYQLTKMNLLPAIIKKGKTICAFEAGTYFKEYDNKNNQKLTEKLSVCRNVNDKLWVPLCFDPSLSDLLIAYLQKSSEEKFATLYKKEFDRQFSTRSEWDNLYSFILNLYYEQMSATRPAAKILKETKFEGIFETQRLSFSDGLSNWSTSLYFENCKKEKCDYTYSHCEGTNFSEHACEETRGVATFENESTILMKEFCGDQKVTLQKKDGKWEVGDGCQIPRVVQDLAPIEQLKQVVYESSFNCLSEKLSEVETLICHSADLSRADKWLSDLYQEMRKRKFEVKDQSAWLKNRKKCFEKEADLCLTQMYQKRIADWSLRLKK